MDTASRPHAGFSGAEPPTALPGTVAAIGDRVLQCWIDLLPPDQARNLRRLHEQVRANFPQAQPTVRWGSVVYWQARRACMTVTLHRRGLQLQPQRAAREPDPRRRPPAGRRVASAPPAAPVRLPHGRPWSSTQHAALDAALSAAFAPIPAAWHAQGRSRF